jgi:hypothetical protein
MRYYQESKANAQIKLNATNEAFMFLIEHESGGLRETAKILRLFDTLFVLCLHLGIGYSIYYYL